MYITFCFLKNNYIINIHESTTNSRTRTLPRAFTHSHLPTIWPPSQPHISILKILSLRQLRERERQFALEKLVEDRVVLVITKTLKWKEKWRFRIWIKLFHIRMEDSYFSITPLCHIIINKLINITRHLF